MDRVPALLPLLILAACGAMDPYGVPEPDVRFGEPVTGPPGATEPGGSDTWEASTSWNPQGELWEFDLRGADVLGARPLGDLPRALLVEILGEDPPVLQVRTGASIAGSMPAEQDLCVAAVGPIVATGDDAGGFEITLGPHDFDLDGPVAWDAVVLSGVRDFETGVVTDALWQATVDAAGLAAAVYGDVPDPCVALEADGLTCGACAARDGSCVAIAFEPAAGRPQALMFEPVQPGDVAANPDCD